MKTKPPQEPNDRRPQTDPVWCLPRFVTRRPYTEARRLILQLFDETYIQAVLERTQGNIAEAARISGVDRSNFRKVLKKINILPK